MRDDGKRILLFQLTEKPVLRKIYIQGNDEIDEKDLTKVFQSEDRRFLDKAALQLLVKQGKAFYQSKGFYNAEIEYAVTPVGDNRVDVTLTVDEGTRFRIQEIDFHGLKEVDSDDLLEAMQTKTYSWWKSWLLGTGRLNEEMLQNDRLLVRQYFLDNGYLDGTVSEPSVEIRDGGIYISFEIQEGEPYSVAEIGVTGDTLQEGAQATLDGIELEVGETFQANVMREDIFRITEKFTDIGYAFANVSPETAVDPSKHTINIRFNVDKGKEVSVNRIRIRGNTKTYDNVIRRELRIAEGEKYSSGKVKRSERLLGRLGYFEEATISTDPVEGSDDEVDLNVNVREAATGTFSAGAGFSSSEGALFNARLSENNILGTGRALSLSADLGSERENFVLSLRDRRFNDTFWSLGAEALSTQREFSDFDRNLAGGSFSVGYPLEEFFGEWSQDVDFGLEYQYLDIHIDNVNPDQAAQLVVDSEGRSSTSAITPRLVRDTINNPLNPTEGSRQILSVELAGMGGDEEYYLFEARNQWYAP
ncbi:MAG: outer membrane protein assembly factor BamA, partial [Bdellovibrionales bacterium]|nr:outer membrane protein assembly factor BamA [Bdellovibrionales bacterium]